MHKASISNQYPEDQAVRTERKHIKILHFQQFQMKSFAKANTEAAPVGVSKCLRNAAQVLKSTSTKCLTVFQSVSG